MVGALRMTMGGRQWIKVFRRRMMKILRGPTMTPWRSAGELMVLTDGVLGRLVGRVGASETVSNGARKRRFVNPQGAEC